MTTNFVQNLTNDNQTLAPFFILLCFISELDRVYGYCILNAFSF